MKTIVIVRSFLADYIRNPVNVVLLVVVPTVFVVVVSGSLAKFSELLGGGQGSAVETVTAGWAAAFLAGIAMYFQTAATRATDRRLVVAGLPARRLVAARLGAGMVLAALASAAALLALALRTGIGQPQRAVAGTLMFAVIYVAVGAAVGSLSRNPVNGTVIVMFIWILDVFFGPAMGSADLVVTRGLPTHFVTLWMVDLPSRHAGQLAALGWSLAWVVAAIAGAWLLATSRTRTFQRNPAARPPGSARAQSAAALRAVWCEARRNPAQWALFVVVPVVFILMAVAVTPNKPIAVTVTEGGRRLLRALPMADVHAASMAPIAIGSLTALAGLFAFLDSRAGDRRAALAGFRPQALITARLGVLWVMALAATGIALGTTWLVFDAQNWWTYAAANVLIALTYSLVGALLAPLFGRVGGIFVAFLLPFLDLGIVQSPMLHPVPSTLSRFLPGYGGSRVLLDGAFTRGFDTAVPLLIALAWLVALTAVVASVYNRAIAGADQQNGDPVSASSPADAAGSPSASGSSSDSHTPRHVTSSRGAAPLVGAKH